MLKEKTLEKLFYVEESRNSDLAFRRLTDKTQIGASLPRYMQTTTFKFIKLISH